MKEYIGFMMGRYVQRNRTIQVGDSDNVQIWSRKQAAALDPIFAPRSPQRYCKKRSNKEGIKSKSAQLHGNHDEEKLNASRMSYL
ncbi:hypothetical protein OPV22_025617 [Ensete ventricosum]|uniref:Uncharacterized protein n=1 Tax=Ensete ventricosum TaxID=4639 RepID=A0AAV8QJP5_ENSVE|nr:hypothetical protein OPV22_025617 [Ensete ventricosum]